MDEGASMWFLYMGAVWFMAVNFAFVYLEKRVDGLKIEIDELREKLEEHTERE